jgi:hypothetical protein
MIKDVREKKIVKNSKYPLLAAISINTLNELIWGDNALNFLTRGKYDELIPAFNVVIERSIDRSLFYSRIYKEKKDEEFLFSSLKQYIKEKTKEELEAK